MSKVKKTIPTTFTKRKLKSTSAKINVKQHIWWSIIEVKCGFTTLDGPPEGRNLEKVVLLDILLEHLFDYFLIWDNNCERYKFEHSPSD